MFEKLENIISSNEKFSVLYLGPDKKNKTLFSDQKVKNSIEIWSYGNYLKKLFSYISVEITLLSINKNSIFHTKIIYKYIHETCLWN